MYSQVYTGHRFPYALKLLLQIIKQRGRQNFASFLSIRVEKGKTNKIIIPVYLTGPDEPFENLPARA